MKSNVRFQAWSNLNKHSDNSTSDAGSPRFDVEKTKTQFISVDKIVEMESS